MNANGVMWRLRSLVAMSHSPARIAQAMGASEYAVRRVIRGQTSSISPEFHAAALRVFEAWWALRAPTRTPAERNQATRAFQRAAANDWPCPCGLDEDELDSPGYAPMCGWRPARGVGVAADFNSPQKNAEEEIAGEEIA